MFSIGIFSIGKGPALESLRGLPGWAAIRMWRQSRRLRRKIPARGFPIQHRVRFGWMEVCWPAPVRAVGRRCRFGFGSERPIVGGAEPALSLPRNRSRRPGDFCGSRRPNSPRPSLLRIFRQRHLLHLPAAFQPRRNRRLLFLWFLRRVSQLGQKKLLCRRKARRRRSLLGRTALLGRLLLGNPGCPESEGSPARRNLHLQRLIWGFPKGKEPRLLYPADAFLPPNERSASGFGRLSKADRGVCESKTGSKICRPG